MVPSRRRKGDRSMKKVILSADGDSCVYEVPDAVADDLERYCLYFCTEWIRSEPQAKRYRIHGVVCYDQNDFIDYLNLYVFPSQPSRMIETSAGPISAAISRKHTAERRIIIFDCTGK